MNSNSPVGIQISLIMAAVVLTATVAVVVFMLIRLIHVSSSRIVRVVAAVLIALIAGLTPMVVDIVAEIVNRSEGVTRLFVHPSWVIKVAPGLLGLVFGAIASRWRDRRIRS